MITKRTIKLVNSLAYARDRRETGLFVAEGTKCVLDVLPHFTFVAIFLRKNRGWLQTQPLFRPLPEVMPGYAWRTSDDDTPYGHSAVIALLGLPEAADISAVRPTASP